MDTIKILKALSNESRLKILQLLKDPSNFEKQRHLIDDDNFNGGICVGSIRKKLTLSQSTISNFLNSLEDAGLIESKKIHQYTYFRRNEKTIKEFQNWINQHM